MSWLKYQFIHTEYKCQFEDGCRWPRAPHMWACSQLSQGQRCSQRCQRGKGPIPCPVHTQGFYRLGNPLTDSLLPQGKKAHRLLFSWVNHPRDKSENRSKKNIFLLSRGVNNTFFGLFWCLLYTTESTEETTASFVHISEFYLGPQPSEIKSLQLLFTSVVQELKQVNNRNVSLSFPATSMNNTTWGDLPHL